ncbi:hypothetical protein [Pseudoalteromonas piratica]|uniref:Solute-binding protein family 3/N-terminal domain-containing protein n=1 Tax=Pseudoalteromonas piratica TaxID=1348114 RepID=A0A0A7EKF6_9GAMM|nr:hypothetical protein [Pseudoalteromonas piratica]AIY67038.1 hypothetical protein OM33_18360 [Pseudoalteromonas piratica]
MFKRFIAIFLLIAFVPFSALGKIIVFSENLTGYQYYNEHGDFVGPNFSKVEKALKRANIEYELNVLPWSLAYNGVMREANACIFSLARLPMREPKFQWVAKLSRFSAYFYALPEKQIKLDSISAAKNYKTAVIENNFSHHFLTQHGFELGAQLLVIENVDKLFHIMRQRKNLLDLIVLNETQYKSKRQLDATAPKLAKVLKLGEDATSLYFACNLAMSQDLIAKLKAGFEDTNP